MNARDKKNETPLDLALKKKQVGIFAKTALYVRWVRLVLLYTTQRFGASVGANRVAGGEPGPFTIALNDGVVFVAFKWRTL